MRKLSMMTFSVAMAVLLAMPVSAQDLGDPAPPLEIAEWIKGGPVNLAEGKGKTVYVIEFWATWCVPCRKTIPHLSELQRKYKDRNVVFIGISDEDAATVRPFVEEQGKKMDYVVAADKNLATSRAYRGPFNARGIPHAFVVDRQGNFAWHGHPLDLERVLDRVAEGETIDPAKEAFDAEMRELLPLWAMEYLVLAKYGRDTAGADELAGRLLEQAHLIPDLASQLARRILSGEDMAHQTPDFATKLAKLAYDVSNGEDVASTETYARALFQGGKEADAIALQKKAIDLAKDDPKIRAQLQATLRQYQTR